jgi:cysteinyl-tRNA synthetase
VTEKFFLYNTLSHQVEEFKPIDPPRVTMYTCGPTVYDWAHLGHMRTYTNTDVLRRALTWAGFKVFQVMNITDVGHLTSDADTGEDKMEKGARREGKSVWEIAKFYTKDFFATTDGLNIKRPDQVCRATDHIQEQIDLVKKLEEKGYLYRTERGLYFDTGKLSDYGKLTNLRPDQLLEGARVEPVPGKRNPTDFAVWLFSPGDKKRQMEWDSPWGKGFPGWHLECSTMSMKYLGETIDIHTGGIDHIPIHHTNEMAQSEAATGKPFVRYWFHNAFLLVEGKKMSKSKGNFFRRQDVLDRGFELLDLRYLFLTAHYRSEMNFTWEALEGARVALGKLRQEVLAWKEENKEGGEQSQAYLDKFTKAVASDLDIPKAMVVLWRLVKDAKLSPADKLATLLKFDLVMGLGLGGVEPIRIPDEVQGMLEKRENFRKQGKWQEADKVRAKIEKRGFLIEDTPKGPKLRPRTGP